MKKFLNKFLVLSAIFLIFNYPKEYKFNAFIKSYSIGILIYYVLKLSKRIKNKEEDDNKL